MSTKEFELFPSGRARLLFVAVALAGALVVVFGAAFAASIIPARRAMSVDPMTTLRHD